MIEGTAEVMHVAGESAEGPASMGIRFLTVDDEGAELLQALGSVFQADGPEALREALETAGAECERRKLEEESTEPLGPPGTEELPVTERITPIRLEDLEQAARMGGGGSVPDPSVVHATEGARRRDLDDTAPIPPPAGAASEPTIVVAESEPSEGPDPESTAEGTAKTEAASADAADAGAEWDDGAVEPEPGLRPADIPADEHGDAAIDLDPLSKTLDIARESRNLPRDPRSRPAAEPRRGSAWVWALGLVTFGIGAWLLWSYRELAPRPQLAASEELPGWEGRDPYEVVEERGAEASEGYAPATQVPAEPPVTDGVLPSATSAPVASASRDQEAEPGQPFHTLRELSWSRQGDELWIDLVLDGVAAAGRYHAFRTPQDPPRIVIQLFGVDEPYPLEELGIDSELVRSIRLGFHAGDELEQRVVLDLAGPGVSLRRVENLEGMLRVVLGPS